MTRTVPLPRKAAIIGGGVIGGGWAARFLLHGWQVSVYDPKPDAQLRLQRVIDSARRSLPSLADVAMPAEGSLTITDSLADAVADARWVQESVPEDLNLKRRVIAGIEGHVAPDCVVASSTSGFRPAELRQGASVPGRIVVAHPFNPVYLLPLVELVAGDDVNDGVVASATATLSSVGMHPLLVRKEIDAHIADRLLESVWREALWLIDDNVATTHEVDDAIRYGFGLRWAQMGLFETYRLAGGDDGMAHFLAQFGPTLKWPWTHLMDVPELNDDLVNKIVSQSDAQSGHLSISELEEQRDRNLVALLRALKSVDAGAGAVLKAHDERLASMAPQITALTASDEPLHMLDLEVLPAWIDYNQHMTEHRYLEVFGYTSDRLLQHIGMDQAYVATGRSYYTVETHICHLGEAKVGQRMYTTTQILLVDDKRLHVFHRLHAVDDQRLLATAEQMLLHVDARAGSASNADAKLLAVLKPLAAAHAGLAQPAARGRYVGQRRDKNGSGK